jgi:hypothetical protein
LRKKEYLHALLNMLDPEKEPVEIQEEAAYALGNICRDCEYLSSLAWYIQRLT